MTAYTKNNSVRSPVRPVRDETPNRVYEHISRRIRRINSDEIGGFGLLGILIVIAIIASAAVGGGFYWNETQKQKSMIQTGLEAEKRAKELVDTINRRQQEIYGGSTSINYEADKIDTSNWKTYRNEKYGFEVKYPPDYIFREKIAYNYTDVIIQNYQDCKDCPDYGYFPKNDELRMSIRVSNKINKWGPNSEAPGTYTGLIEVPANGMTIDDWLKNREFVYDYSGRLDINLSKSRAILAEKELIDWSVRSSVSNPDYRQLNESRVSGKVFAIRSGVAYEITYSPFDTKLMNKFEKILPTFEFID